MENQTVQQHVSDDTDDDGEEVLSFDHQNNESLDWNQAALDILQVFGPGDDGNVGLQAAPAVGNRGGRWYYVTRREQIQVRKFNVVGTMLHIRARRRAYETDYATVMANLYNMFEEIIEDTVGNDPPKGIWERYVVQSPDLDTPISVRFQPAKYIMAESFIAVAEHVVRSRKRFNLDNGVRISMTTVDVPQGRSIEDPLQESQPQSL